MTIECKKQSSHHSIRKIMGFVIIAVILLGVTGGIIYYISHREIPQPSEAELAALNEIFDAEYKVEDYRVVTEEIMLKERREKFKAVKKVFITPSGDYAFISKPVAYNGPITLAVGISKSNGHTVGMRIVEHMETEHYVRDMCNDWFIDRFKDKSSKQYLKTVKLNAAKDDEVVLITGATVTTDGIVNGVNACMGVYSETVSNTVADSVPYMVRFEREEGDGPEETEAVAIRAYGVVLGEISLEQIKKLPSVKRTLTINSTSGTTNHTFRGTLLSNVISTFNPDLLYEYQMVQPIGVDDYISNISMEEVLAENKVYLMYEDNNEPLLKKSGEPGAMRIVMLDDFFGQRFTNYLIEIILE